MSVVYYSWQASPTNEVLHTTFCLVEQALNLLPLTPVSADPCDLNTITPNDFLSGEYSTQIPSLFGSYEFDHRKHYARAQSYANATWSRWIREYVLTLNRRSNWQTPAEKHLQTGVLVWIAKGPGSLGVTTLPFGLWNYVTVPIGSLASPFYVRRPLHSCARL